MPLPRDPDRDDALPLALDLTEQTARFEREAITRVVLSPLVRRAVAASEEVHRRDEFVWKWAHEAIRAVTLSSVAEASRERAIELKVTYAVLMTVLDDAADRRQDAALFDLLGNCVFTLSAQRRQCDRFPRLGAVWAELLEGIGRLSPARALMSWFAFDHETVVHAGQYSLLANAQRRTLNYGELLRWNAESFFIHPLMDIDLMFTPSSNLAELGIARQIVTHGQHMCAIANWLGTWERELREGDLSSGVVVSALERQALSIDDIDDPEAATELIREAHLEEWWLTQWQHHCRAIARLPKLTMFDKARYLGGLERVYHLQMLSKGRL